MRDRGALALTSLTGYGTSLAIIDGVLG